MIIALQIAAILGFKLSWPKTKLQNVGAGDLPSTILIDSVPVEGVEEFIYMSPTIDNSHFSSVSIKLCELLPKLSIPLFGVQHIMEICPPAAVDLRRSLAAALLHSKLLLFGSNKNLLVFNKKLIRKLAYYFFICI